MMKKIEVSYAEEATNNLRPTVWGINCSNIISVVFIVLEILESRLGMRMTPGSALKQ
jgi:hypothetical protein